MSDPTHGYTVDELRSLEELVDSAGWQVLLREAEQEIYNLQVQALEATRSMEDVMYLRGQAVKLASFMSLRDIVEAYTAELTSGGDDAAV